MSEIKRYPIQELANMKPSIEPWRLVGDAGLEHMPSGYFIPFDECQTSAQVLDWVMQVAGKVWGENNDQTLAALVRAFDYHLNPQENLCSGGEERGPVAWGTDTTIHL